MAHTNSDRPVLRSRVRTAGGRLAPRTAALLLALGLLGGAAPASAGLRVFACEPVWAAVAREIGGDRVDVYSATTPQQDVHYIQARPSIIAKVRRADLLVCRGADLEIGWLPVLLRKGRNPRVQPGKPGHLEVARIVPMLDVPTQLDRAAGDIHPRGNPHTQTDPHNIARVADEIARRMAQIDPEGAASYEQRHAAFSKRWSDAIARWELRAAPLRGAEVVTHHLAWVYAAHWLGLHVVAHLEPKPGIPPTAGHLAELLDTLAHRHVRAIVRASYQSGQASDWLSERTGVPAVVLPHAPGAVPGADDLFAMFDILIDTLLETKP